MKPQSEQVSIWKILPTILIISLLTGCAARTNLNPVGRGNLNANVSVGGPIVAAFGTRIPVPYITAGANYGLTDNVNLTGNLHLFSLAYKIAGLNFGISTFPVRQDGFKPTIGIQQSLLILSSFKSGVDIRFRAYPVSSASFAWKYKKITTYNGLDLTTLISSPDYDNEASRFIMSPFLGFRWEFGSRNRLQLELKWHGANIRSDQLAVKYNSIGGYGAIAPLVSLERKY